MWRQIAKKAGHEGRLGGQAGAPLRAARLGRRTDGHILPAAQARCYRRNARNSFGIRLHRCTQNGYCTTSNSPAAPMPPPMHIVTTTYFAPRRLPSISAWPIRRAPVTPYGMADRDRAAVDVEAVVRDAQLVAAVDHLHRERFVQLPQADVVDLQAGALRAASAPRTPGRCPSRPARSRPPRSRGRCPAA